MPRFEWGSDDMKYHLIFFPWVGAVIGALEYGWYNLSFSMNLNLIVFTIFLCVKFSEVSISQFHVQLHIDWNDMLHATCLQCLGDMLLIGTPHA